MVVQGVIGGCTALVARNQAILRAGGEAENPYLAGRGWLWMDRRALDPLDSNNGPLASGGVNLATLKPDVSAGVVDHQTT